MNKELLITLTSNKLVDDLKKQELTPKQRAELINFYKQETGKTNADIAKELNIGEGKVSEYLSLSQSDCNSISEMKRKKYNADFNKMVEEMSRYVFKNRNIKLNHQRKLKIKILIIRLKKLIGGEGI